MDELDIKMRSKLVMTLKVLQEQGNRLREPYSKHLDDGIFEIRGKVGTDISRVMYFFYYGGRIILTNGFIKKTQKTPKSEIERAKQYRKDFWKERENQMKTLDLYLNEQLKMRNSARSGKRTSRKWTSSGRWQMRAFLRT